MELYERPEDELICVNLYAASGDTVAASAADKKGKSRITAEIIALSIFTSSIFIHKYKAERKSAT